MWPALSAGLCALGDNPVTDVQDPEAPEDVEPDDDAEAEEQVDEETEPESA